MSVVSISHTVSLARQKLEIIFIGSGWDVQIRIGARHRVHLDRIGSVRARRILFQMKARIGIFLPVRIVCVESGQTVFLFSESFS